MFLNVQSIARCIITRANVLSLWTCFFATLKKHDTAESVTHRVDASITSTRVSSKLPFDKRKIMLVAHSESISIRVDCDGTGSMLELISITNAITSALSAL